MSIRCLIVFLLRVIHNFGAQQALPAEALDHFQCPFAHVWLKHGPEGAAKVLGIEPHKISVNSVNMTQPRCTLAPWVIGGAHMHALSPGYSADCVDAPGRGSPYAWPLRWKAQLEGKMMLVGFNKVLRETRGVNWYRFDKNWKRGDMYSTKGNSTVLHRGPRMTFLKWSGDIGSKITSCMWMNMSVVGNVRPDWFLDKRGGGSIDVQYLGKEHIYYMGEPRLVRKWRKNDMRNTYFTVSVDELVGFRGVHWPLVVNVPGEGIMPFDTLQKFYNHEVLAEDDEAPFLLDETYVAAGGSCKKIPGGGPGRLPPWHLPSELDKDTNSWRSVEWTGSRHAHEAPVGNMLMV